jgi:hypothetical protein
MATGRDTQLTRQVGEYLAAAELGRRGWIATTFTGSLPGFDILAVNPDGRILEVQVKAIRSATWQLNAGQFLNIDIEKGVQFVRGPKQIKTAGRICIFVQLRDPTEPEARDKFYVFRWEDLQAILLQDYKSGPRPKNPETLHHALYPNRLTPYLDNWQVLNADV